VPRPTVYTTSLLQHPVLPSRTRVAAITQHVEGKLRRRGDRLRWKHVVRRRQSREPFLVGSWIALVAGLALVGIVFPEGETEPTQRQSLSIKRRQMEKMTMLMHVRWSFPTMP
jgi:hypothetical protein